MEVANNFRDRPGIEDAMRRTRKRRRSKATSAEGEENIPKSSRTRRHSNSSNASTTSLSQAHYSPSSIAPSQTSSVVSAVPAPPIEATEPTLEAQVERIERFALSKEPNEFQRRRDGFNYLTAALIRKRALGIQQGAWPHHSDAAGADGSFTNWMCKGALCFDSMKMRQIEHGWRCSGRKERLLLKRRW